MSSVCYASLNAFAYGDADYKVRCLNNFTGISHRKDCCTEMTWATVKFVSLLVNTFTYLDITAAMPHPVSSSLPNAGRFSIPLGVYRCVDGNVRRGESLNDYVSIREGIRFFCLVESEPASVGVSLYSVRTEKSACFFDIINFELTPKPIPNETRPTGQNAMPYVQF